MLSLQIKWIEPCEERSQGRRRSHIHSQKKKLRPQYLNQKQIEILIETELNLPRT